MMQVKNSKGEWIDIGEIGSAGLIEYRIKPDKKPDVVKHYQMSSGFILNTVPCNGCGEDELKLTFDGETGKLKSAEVLNANS